MDLLCQIFQESVQITHLTVATQASASTKVGFVIEILIVLEVRTRRVVPQRNVRSTNTSATIMPAFLTCGSVTATMIAETTAMSTALVFHRTGHVGTIFSSARAEGASLHPGFATETRTVPSARTSPQVVSLPLKTLARLPISGASRESACLDAGAVIMRRTALMARMR